jgi:hypothetical protein
MGITGKPEGMNGAVAPVLWAEGKREEVFRYVAQDMRTTLELATACEVLGALRWIARSGNLRSMVLSEGWLTVETARSLLVSMLEDLFRRLRVRERIRQNPNGPVLEKFAEYLVARGHGLDTVHQCVFAAEHFGQWLGR